MTACSSRFIRRRLERQARWSSGSISSVRATPTRILPSRQPRRPIGTQQRPRRPEIPAPGAAQLLSHPAGRKAARSAPLRFRRSAAPRREARSGAERPSVTPRRGQGGARPSATGAERREEGGAGRHRDKMVPQLPAAARRAGQELGRAWTPSPPRDHRARTHSHGRGPRDTSIGDPPERPRRTRRRPSGARSLKPQHNGAGAAPHVRQSPPAPRPARAQISRERRRREQGVRCRSRQGAPCCSRGGRASVHRRFGVPPLPYPAAGGLQQGFAESQQHGECHTLHCYVG